MIKKAIIRSLWGSKCRLKCFGGGHFEIRDCEGTITIVNDGIVEFATEKGNSYLVRPVK